MGTTHNYTVQGLFFNDFPQLNIFPGWLRDGAPEYLLRWNDAPCNGNKRYACESKFFLIIF